MADAAPLSMRIELFQDLSLPSQPRDRSRLLAEILADEGVATGSRVGVIGWKDYARPEILDAPAFLVDELRGITGAPAPSRTLPGCSSMPPTGCVSSMRSNSWQPSSTALARPPTALDNFFSGSGPG